MDNQTAVTISLVSISVSVVRPALATDPLQTVWRTSQGQPPASGDDPSRKIVSAPERGWPSRLSGEMVLDDDDLWFEVALISVANVGRTAVWASDVGLDFGSESRLPARNRLTMTLTPIAVAGGLSDNAPARLEPGQAVVMYVPMVESIACAGRSTGRKRVTVRATATLAGRRARRSSLRRAWRMDATASYLYPHAEPTPMVRVYQELVGGWRKSDISQLYEAWLAVWGAMEASAGDGAIADALEPYVESPIARFQLATRLSEARRSTRRQPPEP